MRAHYFLEERINDPRGPLFDEPTKFFFVLIIGGTLLVDYLLEYRHPVYQVVSVCVVIRYLTIHCYVKYLEDDFEDLLLLLALILQYVFGSLIKYIVELLLDLEKGHPRLSELKFVFL